MSNATIAPVRRSVFVLAPPERAFRVFTEAYVITKGGPLNATYFYMLYLYEEAFQNFNMGYASALG